MSTLVCSGTWYLEVVLTRYPIKILCWGWDESRDDRWVARTLGRSVSAGMRREPRKPGGVRSHGSEKFSFLAVWIRVLSVTSVICDCFNNTKKKMRNSKLSSQSSGCCLK